MQQLLGAAFLPPPGASAPPGVALLPQQSEDQLQLSEAHSRLDRVLDFLVRDAGYAFLHDARPAGGGSVRLPAEARRGERPCAGPPRRLGEHASARWPARVPPVDDEEARSIRIGLDASKYAQHPEDLVLVRRFASLLVEASPAAEDSVNHDAFFKTVLQGVRLMHLCAFEYSDVVLVLAHASVYFQSTFAAIGQMMSKTEAAHVCVLLMFLAHAFVLDETCPLWCWRKHIFRKYCTLKVLDAALFRLFELRGFRLRITPEEERDALSSLLHTPSPRDPQDVGDVSITRAVAACQDQGDIPGQCCCQGSCHCQLRRRLQF